MNARLLVVQLAAVLVYMHLWFAYAAKAKRNDIADVAWGLGFMLIAAIGYWHAPGTKTLVVLALVAVWGFRLASHIFARFRSHDIEDRRYQEMRKEWGTHELLRSWWDIFVSQGFFMLLVATPIVVLPHVTMQDWSAVHWAGFALWIFGFAFEVIGDRQLREFLADKERVEKEKVMRTGLWKYTRHPNYFGEATLWWGLWLITFSPLAWLTVIGPITITLLLRFVSGVPLAERGFAGNPSFEEYKRSTPAMLPNFFIR